MTGNCPLKQRQKQQEYVETKTWLNKGITAAQNGLSNDIHKQWLEQGMAKTWSGYNMAI